MVHNRAIGFPCNYSWWSQQQIAFFQVKASNFPLRKFQVATTLRTEVEYITSDRPDELLMRI